MADSASELKERTQGSRYLELDGLRGIAAFTVVWHHFWLMFELPNHWYVVPLLAGRQGVMLFFVLSGFVLSLPFWNRGTTGNYSSYLTRRFFRIYVPYAAAVLLSAAGGRFAGVHPSTLGWFYHDTWQSPVTWSLVGYQLMMGPGKELNNAFWSLGIEVQMSILFPLLLLLIKALRPIGATMLALLSTVVAVHVSAKGAANPFLYLDTIHYGGIFLLGALLAWKREWWREVWGKAHVLLRGLFFGLSALAFWGDGSAFWALFHLREVPDVLPAFGACGLVVCALNVRWFRVTLRGVVPEYLGRISYSLYLLHESVLYLLAIFGFGKLPLPWIAALYFVVAMMMAHLFCMGVEEPSLRMGKRLAGGRESVKSKAGPG